MGNNVGLNNCFIICVDQQCVVTDVRARLLLSKFLCFINWNSFCVHNCGLVNSFIIQTSIPCYTDWSLHTPHMMCIQTLYGRVTWIVKICWIHGTVHNPVQILKDTGVRNTKQTWDFFLNLWFVLYILVILISTCQHLNERCLTPKIGIQSCTISWYSWTHL